MIITHQRVRICDDCQNGDLADLKILIAKGIDVNAYCPMYNLLPIFYSGWLCRDHLVETLINAGAIIDKEGSHGTALRGALENAGTYSGNPDIVSRCGKTIVQLMKFGASLDTALKCETSRCQSKKKDVDIGMQLGVIKAAIAEGKKYEKCRAVFYTSSRIFTFLIQKSRMENIWLK